MLEPGQIELHVHNDGADPVEIRQVIVNDAFVDFTQSDDEIGRLGASKIDVQYPWLEGSRTRSAAHRHRGDDRPRDRRGRGDPTGGPGLLRPHGADRSLRRGDPGGHRDALAALGARGRPALDALPARLHRPARVPGGGRPARGHRAGRHRPASLGGAALVWLGAAGAYLALAATDSWLPGRGWSRPAAASVAARPSWWRSDQPAQPRRKARDRLRLTVGSLPLRAALVVGFVGPQHHGGTGHRRAGVACENRVRLGRLVLLGVLAGAPAVLGAWIGASAFNPSLAALMFGIGAGAIAQVIVQIARRFGMRPAASSTRSRRPGC